MTKLRAFTLIELLLVTGIISLLMSVVFFKVTEAKKKAEDAHMIQESGQVATAINLYQDDHGGKVPGNLTVTGGGVSRTILETDTPVTVIDPNTSYEAVMQQLVTGGYLPEIPYSPSGDAYSYTIAADGNSASFTATFNYPPGGNTLQAACVWLSLTNPCPTTLHTSNGYNQVLFEYNQDHQVIQPSGTDGIYGISYNGINGTFAVTTWIAYDPVNPANSHLVVWPYNTANSTSNYDCGSGAGSYSPTSSLTGQVIHCVDTSDYFYNTYIDLILIDAAQGIINISPRSI